MDRAKPAGRSILFCFLVSGLAVFFPLFSGGAESPWKLLDYDQAALTCEAEFQQGKDVDFSLDWYSEGRGVLSWVLDESSFTGSRILVQPVISRPGPFNDLVVTARRGDAAYPLRCTFPLETGRKLFALPFSADGPFLRHRKKAFLLQKESAGSLFGGTACMPDPVPRTGLFRMQERENDPVLTPAVERTSGFLPAVSVCRGHVVLAWDSRGVSGTHEVWFLRAAGRPVQLSAAGRFPQLAVDGDSVFCLWRSGGDLVLSTSRDRGAAWRVKRRVASAAAGIGHFSIAAAGGRVLVWWETSEGISWRVLSGEPGSTFSVSGTLPDNCSRASAAVLASGGFALLYLRDAPRGSEAVFERFDAAGKRSGVEKKLVSTTNVEEAVLTRSGDQYHAAFFVSMPGGRRLAHRSETTGLYLLPETLGEPFHLHIGRWNDRLCISYAVVRAGRIELEGFVSSDEGFTWEGPFRFFSGRDLCVLNVDCVVSWSGLTKGGSLSINGTSVYSIPGSVPAGRTVMSLDRTFCAPQGWIQDQISFSGTGTVDTGVLFTTPNAETAMTGYSQVHAEEHAASSPLRKAAADLALLSEGMYENRLKGRCKNEFVLNIGLINMSPVPSRASTLSVSIGENAVVRKQFGPLSGGMEREVSLRFLLPPVEGEYTLHCIVETERDSDVTNNRLSFPLKVVPGNDVVVRVGDAVRFFLPEQKRIKVQSTKETYLIVTGKGGSGVEMKGTLIRRGRQKEVTLARPLILDAGEYELLLREPLDPGEYTAVLKEKTDAYEPNDTVEHAASIMPNVELEVSLAPAGDSDWFSLPLAEAGHLSFSTQKPIDGVELSLRKKRGPWLIRRHPLPCSLFLEPAVYEVCLEEKWQRAVKKSFRFRVNYFEKQDSDEPNDLLVEATRVSMNEERTITLFPPGDRDWFSLDCPKNGYLCITAEGKGVSPDVTCELRGADGGWIRKASPLPLNVKVKKGIVSFCFETKAASRDAFVFTPFFREEFDRFEPNDNRLSARKVSLPADLFVALWPEGDEDWFFCDFEKRGYVTITLPRGPLKGVVPAVSLCNEEGMRSRVKPAPALFRVDKGRNYFKVAGLQSGAFEGPFPLRFSFDPEFDPSEPNDAAGTATDVPCPGKTRFALWPPDDEDYFKFSLPYGGYLALTVEGAEADQTFEFTFIDKSRKRRVQIGRRAVVRIEKGAVVCRVKAGSPVGKKRELRLLAALYRMFDPAEPDDSIADAGTLRVGTWLSLCIFPAGDKDYYAFSVEKNGTYLLQAKSVPEGMVIAADVLGKKGRIKTAGIRPGKSFALKKGDYHLMIYALSKQESRELFRLKLETMP